MEVHMKNDLMGFMKLTEVLKIIPVGKSTWWEGIKHGVYPRPVRLSKRAVAWKVVDIQALIQKIGEEGGQSEK